MHQRYSDPTSEIHFMQRAETWNAPERGNSDELNAARVRAARTTQVGWTTAQIADDLHIAERFVKSRLHVALRALQRTLELAPGCAGKAQQTAGS